MTKPQRGTWLLLSMMLFAVPAAAAEPAEECMLDVSALKPLLVGKKVKSYKLSRSGQRVVEKGVVQGRTVEVSQGGCAHLGVEVRATLLKGESTGPIVPLGQKVLSALPQAEADSALQVLQRALSQAASTPADGGQPPKLDCGDAFCEVRIEKDRLLLNYSFAL